MVPFVKGPIVKGPTPWAIILCRFNDVPELNLPYSDFFNFVSEYGKGGLFDYWRDVSYGTIDLAGSQVYGWYTMQYSFVKDSKDPLKNGTQGRFAWISEATRLAQEHGVDLSRFYGIIAVINANADDSNGGRNIALGIAGAWGQTNWRWCKKCQGLVYAGNSSPGACPAGDFHDLSGSADYALALNDSKNSLQDNWRWCKKCQGLAYAGNMSPGACPAGDFHDHTGSADYSLGMNTVGFSGQDNWRWCKKCQGLAYAGNMSPGACPAGDFHDHTGSADYSLVQVGSNLNTTFAAHETGHSYGLSHSWLANPDTEYGDAWDIMSAMGVKSYDNLEYGPAGPRINAPTLDKLGWMPPERIRTFYPNQGDTGTIDLVALHRPEISGYLMVRIVTSNHIYTVEFRQATGWDSGIGRDGVLIHELRSIYTIGQNRWRWCKKCQELFYAGYAACPAGDLHDLSESYNYILTRNDPNFVGQSNWRWCNKCQGLSYAGNTSPGICPAGGLHDHARSSDYALVRNDPNFVGQSNWRWCNKCQGLVYSGNASSGACPAGGYHDTSGSAEYSLIHDQMGIAGQDNWRWCKKCQGLAYAGFGSCLAGGFHDPSGSMDYALVLNDPNFPGQDNWHWCKKCQGLAYAGNSSSGKCFAGGFHDYTGSANYRLLQNSGNADGQNNWRWCKKCQGLAYAGNMSPGACPAGSLHDHMGSSDYTLANFAQDKTYLIKSDWQPGQVFEDMSRGIRVVIGTIDGLSSKATVTIGV